jgi:hypothetical protein
MAWPNRSSALSVVDAGGKGCGGGSRFEARFTRRAALPGRGGIVDEKKCETLEANVRDLGSSSQLSRAAAALCG